MAGEQTEISTQQVDRRAEVPDLLPYLKPPPQERVINIEISDIKPQTAYPSAVRQLEKLTAAQNYSEVGQSGPAVASRASAENQAIEALRKFEVLFGRDSLRVAMDLADHYPRLLRATIIKLAELQGVKENIMSEEQPGRIIHEYRDPADKIAKSITERKGWQWPFYGSVDATVSYVRAIKQYCNQSEEGIKFLNEKFIGRDGQEHTVGESLKAAMGWIKTRLDTNPEGLLEFKKLFEKSMENQTWKDSWDSYTHADGTIANHNSGIASIEVQASTYDALIDASELYETLGNAESQEEAAELRSRAAKLRQQVEEKFWTEDERGGYFVLATDRDEKGNLRPLKIRTSNMGHLLNSRLLDGDDSEVVKRRQAVIKTIFSKEMLNASGIRTLSNKEKRFKPGGYHNGNVWLWDTHLISQGLERQGYNGLAWDLNKRIWTVMDKFKKFPEFARGGDEPEPVLNTRIVDIWEEEYNRKNRIEQPPQEIQAWSVAAILAAKFKKTNQLRKLGSPPTASDPQKRVFEETVLKTLI